MNADALLQLADSHQRAGRFADAEAAYRQALAADRDHPHALHQLALLLLHRGDPGAAVDLLRRLTRRAPNDPVAHLHLGRAYAAAGQLDRAAGACRRAADLAPRLPDAHANLGVCLAKLGRHADAVASLRHALDLTQGKAPAIEVNLALSLHALGRYDDALAAYDHVVSLAPDYAKAHEYRGLTLAALTRHADAVPAYHRSLRLHDANSTAWNNLGVSLQKLGDAQAAAHAFFRAAQFDPAYADAHNNLATALLDAGRPPADALPHYDRAVSLAPDRSDFRHHRALAYLAAGDFARGWPEYEHRIALPNWSHLAPILARHPRWDGRPAPDITLCVLAEQAFGDALMFARFLPLAAVRVGTLVAQCHPALLRLFQSSFPRITFVPLGQPLPPFDLVCPLATLPLALGATADTIPATIPCLSVRPDLVATWRARLANVTTRKIGIVWAGSTTDPHRSLQLSHLARLAELPNTHIFSLQKDPSPEDEALLTSLRFTSLSPSLSDFADTAAAIANLDLVITIDTATAHLAGALGAATHTLLRSAPDWRWSLADATTPWYPAMHLVRQPAPGDWPGAVARLLATLRG